jgi:hypothetical protein
MLRWRREKRREIKSGLQVCSQLGHNTPRKEAIGTG